MKRAFFPFLSAALALQAAPARAEQAPPAPAAAAPRLRTYALVVGSNAGGPGQQPLRFAEDDADRVAHVLRELGRLDPADVHVLLRATPAEVMRALGDLGAAVRAGAARGEQAEVFFYYSGHAKATAAILGNDELPLVRLREGLAALAAALTIVVLDACQSGAFARAKGAESAADFTYNSVSRLTQRGLAVMASSSAQELSQESDELRGSYFTHHLVTALRGAADADGDGRVSLDEAYRYAFRRTLASTARTQIGEQHVTLDVDMAGQGETPLTYPVEARAKLELPAALDARVLVQQRASRAVVAEVQKAPGTAVHLALAPGSYDAIVGRAGGVVVQCRLELADDRVTPLDASGCPTVTPDESRGKGEARDERDERDRRVDSEIDRWQIEAAVGAMTQQHDGFTDRLQTFGYAERGSWTDAAGARLMLGVSRSLVPHIAGFLQASTLAGDTYERSIGGSTDRASFMGYAAAIGVRASADIAGHWLGIYGQAGAGVSLGTLSYVTKQSGAMPSTTDVFIGYSLLGAVGAEVKFRRAPLGLFLQGEYDRAPAIRDLIGDTHDSGGFGVLTGLRWRLGGEP